MFVEYEESSTQWYLYDTIQNKRGVAIRIYDFVWILLPKELKGEKELNTNMNDKIYIIQQIFSRKEPFKWMLVLYKNDSFWDLINGVHIQFETRNSCWYNVPTTYLGCFGIEKYK